VVGVGLAIVTVEVLARVKAIKVNGWITMLGCGVPSNGPLMRAACTGMFPGPGQRAGGGHLLDNAGRPCGSAADRPRRLRHALPGRWACTQRSVLVADPRELPEPVRPESAWSTSPSREPHQWALNPTGCRRPRKVRDLAAGLPARPGHPRRQVYRPVIAQEESVRSASDKALDCPDRSGHR
jgi:hypothetical protein